MGYGGQQLVIRNRVLGSTEYVCDSDNQRAMNCPTTNEALFVVVRFIARPDITQLN
jgi:hypothetical protein